MMGQVEAPELLPDLEEALGALLEKRGGPGNHLP